MQDTFCSIEAYFEGFGLAMGLIRVGIVYKFA